MQTPLSRKELKDFEKMMLRQFREEYQKALTRGAFDEKEFGDRHNHTIAKIAWRKSAGRVVLLRSAAIEAELNFSFF